MVQVKEHLPSKSEALSSTFNAANNNNNYNNNSSTTSNNSNCHLFSTCYIIGFLQPFYRWEY
jgi:hypothetical protein